MSIKCQGNYKNTFGTEKFTCTPLNSLKSVERKMKQCACVTHGRLK